MKPHPVLLLVRELGIGGCERDLTRVACGLDRSRFEPHVGCFHIEGLRTAEIRNAGIPIVRFALTSFGNLSFPKAVAQLRAYVRDHSVRLVHSFDAPMACLAGSYALLPGGPPVLLSHLWHRDLILGRVQRALLGLGDRTGDSFVSNSLAVARELSGRYGVDREKIFLCHNGVDTARFHAAQRHRMPGTGHAAFVVGTVCALRPEKRVDLLIEAFARLPKRNEGKLVIVGDGPERPAIEEKIRALGIAAQCVLAGQQQQVEPWLAGMDIFVLASDSESFPNSLLEAMAAGCAVIGSNVGGVPELIPTEETGLLFSPGKGDELFAALKRLSEDPSLYGKLGAAASRRAAEQFSVERNVGRTASIYRYLIEGGARPPREAY